MSTLIIPILMGVSVIIFSIFYLKYQQRRCYLEQNGLINGKEFVRTCSGYANFKDHESIEALRQRLNDYYALPLETQKLRRQSVDKHRRNERTWEI